MPGFEWLGEEERAEVLAVLDTGVLMRYGFDPVRGGRWPALELERALAERIGARHAHVCSSGTAALFTALAACGVGAGDEVVLPPFSFVADVEAVLWLGAVPVFAEIDESLGLNPDSVADAITARTKAVLVVHMCGAMARIDRLLEVCRARGVTLVEDVAQALGATYRGVPLGRFGRAASYSFDFNKTVTCGEGGAVVTNEEAIHDLIQSFSDHGHDHRGRVRLADGHRIFGMNFRLGELHAAVGLAQIRKLDAMLEVQRKNLRFLERGLADLPRVRFRDVPDPEGDSCTFLSVLLPSETEARQAVHALDAAGVDGVFYWYDTNWHYHRGWTHFKQLASPSAMAVEKAGWLGIFPSVELPRSDAVMSRTISFLIKLSWSEAELEQRLETMRAVLA